ncbi:hypothetical protein IQ238_29895 [Pleurocapsales cyanobacterium LEGE 06147]|nr:hypothetical protein [Pleurocapsales cyanobacterium LEGE 06147]
MRIFFKFSTIVLISMAIVLTIGSYLKGMMQPYEVKQDSGSAFVSSVLTQIDAAQIIDYRREQMKALSAHS